MGKNREQRSTTAIQAKNCKFYFLKVQEHTYSFTFTPPFFVGRGIQVYEHVIFKKIIMMSTFNLFHD